MICQRVFVLLALVAFFACGVPLAGAQRPRPLPEAHSGWTHKAPVFARDFMVAAANPLAVDAGYEILKRGGSAVDAAIAVQLVLNLVEPQSSGLGGGTFMLVSDARTGERGLRVYDGRETAPDAAKPGRFLDASGKPLGFREAVIGGRSVGVPGLLAAFAAAHRRHGRLPWASLFTPAIELSERGFVVSPRLAGLLANEGSMPQPRASAYFFPEGKPLTAGTRVTNPAFAAALREIAAHGTQPFYHGAIARDIVGTVTGAPVNAGDMTLADLARYREAVRAPVCGSYRSFRVCSAPPPSSGGIALIEMLGILERRHFVLLDPGSLASAHAFAEAGRLAYADRYYVADPAFVAAPLWLLDPVYLAERAALLSDERTIDTATRGTPPSAARARKLARREVPALEFPSTSHISIVDREGNAVAMTSSIEYAFGSSLMTASGFLLNNELTDFTWVPMDRGVPVPNRVAGGKRPRSSMAPTIVYDRDGRVFMLVGAAGGPAIINYVAKTVVGVIDWKLDPQAAIDLPYVGSRDGPTEIEADTDATELAPGLRALGHRVTVTPHPSGLQAIVRTGDGWLGGADPRREGTARGD